VPDDHGILDDLEPLLQSREGDGASLLSEGDARQRRWLGLVVGAGVGSAAIAAAMLFWSQKRSARATDAPRRQSTKGKKPIPHDNAHHSHD